MVERSEVVHSPEDGVGDTNNCSYFNYMHLKVYVMRSVKMDHKPAKLILQESEKTEFGQNDRFLVFCSNREKYHSRTYPQNIRVGEGNFFVFYF